MRVYRNRCISYETLDYQIVDSHVEKSDKEIIILYDLIEIKKYRGVVQTTKYYGYSSHDMFFKFFLRWSMVVNLIEEYLTDCSPKATRVTDKKNN